MTKEFSGMARSILEGDREAARKLTEDALAAGLAAEEILNKGFIPGMKELGNLYDAGEVFLPELVRGAEAMKLSLSLLTPHFSGDVEKGNGRIILGTVQGDIHDIGKSIVGSVLSANGFDVIDLGSNVAIDTFVKKVKELKPDIIGMSALITTTMSNAGEVINSLIDKGLRDSVKVIVGGAPVNRKWAEEIGADGFAPTAAAAVNEVISLLSH